jgi:ATP-dependent helicase/nuclease subunit B
MNHYLISEYIEQGYLIITASQRQARFLKVAYGEKMMNEGKAAWLTPEILPWNTWIKDSWNNQQLISQSSSMVLNPSQVRLIWQSIIGSSRYTESLLQVNSIVDAAIHAYELCQSWNIKIFPEEVFLNHDAQAFQSWAATYKNKLSKNNWVDIVNVPDLLVSSVFVPDYKGLVIYGYDELTLQQQELLRHIETHDCEVVLHQTAGRNKQVSYLGLPDRTAELRAAACWAKNIMNRERGASIGIVVPDLASTQESVSAIFDEILHPELLLNGPDSILKRYSIAPGKPLSDYPVIHIALEILSLGQLRHSIQKLEVLLRSSYIKGAETERHARAGFYAALRQAGEPSWHLKTLLTYIDYHREYLTIANTFESMLRELVEFIKVKNSRQSTRQWSETFNAWLKIFGWPGDRKLNSNEYQTVEAWGEMLIELASLETVVGSCSYIEALDYLKKIIKEKSFQPETSETPIQISALPGVAGLQFDYLRVIGLHDQVWPGPSIVNPFIPLVLQRDAGVPGALAESMVSRCQLESEALIDGSIEVVFSYPENEDDRVCRPSPLLKKYVIDNIEDSRASHVSYQQLIFDSRDVEMFTDDVAPALAVDDKATGGTGILADQAACPFRAYARHRLYASALADINIGIDPAVRGQLVHQVMQRLWGRINSSESLHQLSLDNLNDLINTVVESIIRQQAKQQPETFSRGFSRLESHRLQSLIRDWLTIEKKRSGFKIRELENRHSINFQSLNLNMRIDRVDELADGKLVIIDYKTGQLNMGKWQGDRTDEPQLPLYAITYEGNICAVAFAGMKKGKLGFIGLAAEEGLIDGVKGISNSEENNGWDGQLQYWQLALGNMAREFATGRAVVDPKDNTTCRYCDLHSLCRIQEKLESRSGWIDEEEPEWHQT